MNLAGVVILGVIALLLIAFLVIYSIKSFGITDVSKLKTISERLESLNKDKTVLSAKIDSADYTTFEKDEFKVKLELVNKEIAYLQKQKNKQEKKQVK